MTISRCSNHRSITNNIAKKFEEPGKASSSESSLVSSRQSSPDISDDSISVCKTVDQDLEEEPRKKPMTVLDTIFENDQVKLVKRCKAQRESFMHKPRNPPVPGKDNRKSSIKTLLDDSGPSFSFNMNMLYPKNVVTYSAYVRNMEGFIKESLGLKKDVKLGHVEKREKTDNPTNKKSESFSEYKNSSGLSKPSVSKSTKINPDSTLNEDNHPSLKRRHARLFISVPKKAGFGYKLKTKEIPQKDFFGIPSLHHAQSELYPNPSKLEVKAEKHVEPPSIIHDPNYEHEWMSKSQYLTKEQYFKVFSKYSQVKTAKLTDIYDPPLTMKEIKKIRRDRRRQQKQQKLKQKARKMVRFKLFDFSRRKEARNLWLRGNQNL